MPRIHLTTFIKAPIQRVFDLGRSIDLHTVSTPGTNEQAIEGVTTGLINIHETVTFRARHLFKVRQHTSKITAMEAPFYFADEMMKGDFKRFYHEHYFKQADNGTIMIDILEFESPYGFAGKLADKFYLKNYLEHFLLKRNSILKEYAETDKWESILK